MCYSMSTMGRWRIALLTIIWLVPVPSPCNGREQAPAKNTPDSSKAEKSDIAAPTVTQNAVFNCQPTEQSDCDKAKQPAYQPHGALEWANAISTVVIAIFAIITAYAIGKQVQTARNTDRAWIIVFPMWDAPPIGYIPEPGDALAYPGRDAKNVFVASAKNTGNTPARIIEFRVKYKQVPSLQDIPQKANYGPRPRSKSSDEILLCKEEQPIGAFAFLEPNIIVTKPEKEKIERQEAFLYAYGILFYKDAFNRMHETKFGFIYHMPIGGDVFERGFRRDKLPAAYNKAT
jgi:hypothetical protein